MSPIVEDIRAAQLTLPNITYPRARVVLTKAEVLVFVKRSQQVVYERAAKYLERRFPMKAGQPQTLVMADGTQWFVKLLADGGCCGDPLRNAPLAAALDGLIQPVES